MFLDFTGHPAAEDECFLHPGGGEELQRVVDHGNVAQRQQSLSAQEKISFKTFESNENWQKTLVYYNRTKTAISMT